MSIINKSRRQHFHESPHQRGSKYFPANPSVFLLTPVPCHPPISFYLLFSVNLNSCLMRRSRTAKRMSPAGWVPAAGLCSASAARSADADVIRYLTAEEAAHRRRPGNGELAAHVWRLVVQDLQNIFVCSDFFFSKMDLGLDEKWLPF